MKLFQAAFLTLTLKHARATSGQVDCATAEPGTFIEDEGLCYSKIDSTLSMDELFELMIDELEEEDPDFENEGDDLERAAANKRPLLMAWKLLEPYKETDQLFPGYMKNKKRKLFVSIKQYGCWCFPRVGKYPYPKHDLPHDGNAVDELDQACRTLATCQKCIQIEEGHDRCNPAKESFGWLRNSNNEMTCEMSKNKNSCKKNSCSCGKQFAETIRDLFLNGFESDKKYMLSKKWMKILKRSGRKDQAYDFEGECTTVSSGMKRLECCGDSYPNKKPYPADERSCCSASGKPYDMIVQQCCSDGRVVDVANGCV